MRLLKSYYVQHFLSSVSSCQRGEPPKYKVFIYSPAEFHNEPQQDQTTHVRSKAARWPSASRRRPRPRRTAGAPGPPHLHYLPPSPNFMKINSFPLLSMSPPGAVISENFCMRLGCETGVGCEGTGWDAGAGTTAGPARRAGEAGAGTPPATAFVKPALGPATVVPGDCTGVLALPTFVRAIVLTGWAIAAPLTLACYAKFKLLHILSVRSYFVCMNEL